MCSRNERDHEARDREGKAEQDQQRTEIEGAAWALLECVPDTHGCEWRRDRHSRQDRGLLRGARFPVSRLLRLGLGSRRDSRLHPDHGCSRTRPSRGRVVGGSARVLSRWGRRIWFRPGRSRIRCRHAGSGHRGGRHGWVVPARCGRKEAAEEECRGDYQRTRDDRPGREKRQPARF